MGTRSSGNGTRSVPATQRELFETEPAPWEADDQRGNSSRRWLLSAGPAQEFDYLVPDALRETDRTRAGGSRRRWGPAIGWWSAIACGWKNRPAGPRRLKPLHSVLDQRSLLSPAMLRLTRWIADYYLCDWAAVLDAVVPAGVRIGAGTRMATLLSVDAEAMQQLLRADRKLGRRASKLGRQLHCRPRRSGGRRVQPSPNSPQAAAAGS